MKTVLNRKSRSNEPSTSTSNFSESDDAFIQSIQITTFTRFFNRKVV